MDNEKFNKLPFKILAIGSLVAIIFTLIWMYGTYQLGVPSYFLLFGVLIIIVSVINFYVYWRKAKINSNAQKNLQAVEEIATSLLEEPTLVYGYCPSCGKAITNKDNKFCENCIKDKGYL